MVGGSSFRVGYSVVVAAEAEIVVSRYLRRLGLVGWVWALSLVLVVVVEVAAAMKCRCVEYVVFLSFCLWHWHQRERERELRIIKNGGRNETVLDVDSSKRQENSTEVLRKHLLCVLEIRS